MRARVRLGPALFVAFCVAAFVAACSGGGTFTPSSPVALPTPAKQKFGKIVAHLFVPKRKHHLGERPDFLPSDATSVVFTLIDVNGQSETSTNWNFSISTSAYCVPYSSGLECSASQAAPAGTDVYQVVAQDCVPSLMRERPRTNPRRPHGVTGGCAYSLVTLSETLASVVVPAGGTATAHFTLSGLVASLGFTGVTAFGNGPNPPALSNGTYSCPSQYSSCYDPLLDVEGVPQAHPVALNAYDAKGEQIIPASGNGTVYGMPLYLQSGAKSGDADAINWSCSDHSVTWETGGGPFTAGNMTLTNGAGASAGINTPVTAPSPSPTTATDFNGATVTAIGSNGIEMNFDGSDSPSGTVTCTATDLQGLSATYYLGDNLIHPTVYVGNGATAGVEAIDVTKGTVTPFTATFNSFAGPRSLATDSLGDLYVADHGANDVLVFPYSYTSSAATTLQIFNTPPPACVSLCYNSPGTPWGVVVDNANSRFFVSDDSSNANVHVFNTGPTPVPQTVIAMPTISPSPMPQSMAFDGSGNLYVGDAGGSGNLYEFTAPFSTASVPAQTIAYGGLSTDMTYDQTNNYLWLADAELNQIVRYTISGTGYSGETVLPHSTYPPIANQDSNINQPLSIALDQNLYPWQASSLSPGGPEYFTSFPNPGTVVAIASSPAPGALVFDGNHTMYVAGNTANSVIAVDTTNYTAGTAYTSSISSPAALAYFNGAIYNSATAATRHWLLHRNRVKPLKIIVVRKSRASTRTHSY